MRDEGAFETFTAIQADLVALRAAMGVLKAIIAGNSRLLNDTSQEVRFLQHEVRALCVRSLWRVSDRVRWL